MTRLIFSAAFVISMTVVCCGIHFKIDQNIDLVWRPHSFDRFADLPSLKEAFIPGRCNSVFDNENLNFTMLALRIHFV